MMEITKANGPLTADEVLWYETQEDGSVRDGERYRRLCLHENYTNYPQLHKKLDPRFAFLGLYPHTMSYHNIQPEV